MNGHRRLVLAIVTAAFRRNLHRLDNMLANQGRSVDTLGHMGTHLVIEFNP